MFEMCVCVCVLLCPTAVLKALDLPDLGKSRSSPPDFHFLQVCNVPLLERDTNASDATVGVSRCRWGLGVRVWCTNVPGEPSERDIELDIGVFVFVFLA